MRSMAVRSDDTSNTSVVKRWAREVLRDLENGVELQGVNISTQTSSNLGKGTPHIPPK